jgi:phenylpropionate dioxygenase-like ring-hydroxylating dioxygenase large terminal subunit
MNLKNFWYIACESKELGADKPLQARLMDEWLALYRDKNGKAVAVIDRCLHRNARLSFGKLTNGELQCPYHGWKYDGAGQVTAVPSEGINFQPKASMCLPQYETREQDGYVYVQLEADSSLHPKEVPFLKPTHQHIRLKHVFEAEVPNCAENFIDIPHTSFVHPNVFRYQKEPQKLLADIEMSDGNVHIRYRGETSNFGIFSKILNRKNTEIVHEDHYYLPNFTHVEYRFTDGKHFNITSQSIPTASGITTVYTDLTYDYGFWNWLAKPFVYLSAKIIIGQDVRIMGQQSAVTKRYGEQFMSTKADFQHILIERIYAALREGKDPRSFTPKKETVEFWI